MRCLLPPIQKKKKEIVNHSRDEVTISPKHSRVPLSEIRNRNNWDKGFDQGSPYYFDGEKGATGERGVAGVVVSETEPPPDAEGNHPVWVNPNGTENEVGDEGDSNSVTPRMFGAVGDGVADDTIAIVNCINHANSTGVSVLFDKNKHYLIKPSEPIEVKVSIDFNGSKISLLSGSATPVFSIVPDSEDTFVVTHSALTKTGVTDARLHGKVFTINSPLSFGNRDGNASMPEIMYKQCVIVDDYGSFIGDTYDVSIVEGEYECKNVHSLNTRPIEISNGVFDYSKLTTAGVYVFIWGGRKNKNAL